MKYRRIFNIKHLLNFLTALFNVLCNLCFCISVVYHAASKDDDEDEDVPGPKPYVEKDVIKPLE